MCQVCGNELGLWSVCISEGRGCLCTGRPELWGALVDLVGWPVSWPSGILVVRPGGCKGPQHFLWQPQDNRMLTNECKG